MAGMEMGETAHHTHGAPVRFAFGAPARPGHPARTVKIGIRDLTFDTSEIVVHPGETVRFVVTNTSSIEHEFAIADAATERAHRKEMAEFHDRGEVMQHDDPNVITIDPGQTRELAWTFRGAGKLEFDCTIPGHYESGMKGTIIVR